MLNVNLALEEVLQHTLYLFKNESDLLQAILELQVTFTKKRDLSDFKDYTQSARLVSAYTAFYMLTNIPKYAYLVQRLPKVYQEDFFSLTFVDLGTGPGTFVWAHALFNKENYSSCIGVDTSSVMLEQGRKLAKHFFPTRSIAFQSKIPKIKNQILCLGHSFNEMGVQLTRRLIEEMEPKFLLFFLVGTKEVFQQFLTLRQELIEDGDYEILYPCAKSMTCPLEKNPEDWCHQVMHVNHAHDVERLSQIVKINRREMPLGGFLLVKKSNSVVKQQMSCEHGRYFQTLHETKGQFQLKICNETLVLENLEILKRNLSKEEQKLLSLGRPGDGLSFEREKKGEQFTRVKNLKLHHDR